MLEYIIDSQGWLPQFLVRELSRFFSFFMNFEPTDIMRVA